MLVNELKQRDRILHLKDRMLSETRYASIEQARIITRIYQENEEKSIALKRALSLAAALNEIEIAIDEEELIVGNRTKGVRAGVVFPESGCSWVNREFETLPTRPQDKFQVRQEDIKEFRESIYPYWMTRSMEEGIKEVCGDEINQIKKVVKINQTDHAQGHICPDVSMWLEKGPAGIKKDVEEMQTLHPENEFYQCELIVLEAMQAFMCRYADLAEEMAVTSVHQNTLLKIAKTCRSLALRPAETFYEAVQSIWFLFVVLHMESNASSFSPGRMDQYLYPYYQRDINQGLITKEDALEILECLFLKFNQIVYLRNSGSAKYFAGFPIGFNIAVGGVDEDGNDTYNELSILLLRCQEDLCLPQPNLSVRLNRNTSHELMQAAIQVVSKGSGMPQFFNDEAIIQPLTELGISEKDARNYAIVGCVELTTHGNNLGWSDAAMFNLCKTLELTLNHGIDLLDGKQLGPDYGGLDTYQSYEELETAFQKMIDHYIDRMILVEEDVEKAHQKYLPSAFLSTVINDCTKKGLDVTQGGAHYNLSGIQIIQAASLADSMYALKKLVYEEHQLDPIEVLHAIQDNYEGHDITRAILLNKAEKYGNDEDVVDEIASKWSLYFRNKMREYTNYRGGPFHTGMYTVSAHVPMGENVGASTDGRKAKEPLADGGLSAVYGRDLKGPTAVFKTVSKIDNACTTNGGLLNMKFLPEFFETEEGRNKFEMLLRAFVQLKVPHVQFNVVNKADLLDAKVHPENHASLTIRVAGYTAYFVELDGKLQDEIIARTSYDNI